MATDDPIRELIEEVRAMRQEQREQRELLELLRALLIPASSSADATLLREISRAANGLPFTTAELILRSEFILGESGDNALADAITQVVGELSPRKLGNWLASIEGKPIEDMSVRRVRNTRDGINWKIENVSFKPAELVATKAKAAR